MEYGSYGLEFNVSECEGGHSRGDGFGEEEGALHVVICYFIHVLSSEGEGFGYKGSIGDSDTCEDPSMNWHFRFLCKAGL